MNTPPNDSQISSARRKELRGITMAMKPSLLIGKEGITEAIVTACEEALQRGPVVKIRMHGHDRGERQQLLAELCQHTGAILCGIVGQTASLARESQHENNPLPPG